MSKKYLITSTDVNESSLVDIISDTYDSNSSDAMSGKAVAAFGTPINESIDNINTILDNAGLLPINVTWESGRLDASGNPIPQDNNARTVEFISLNYGETITCDLGASYIWLSMEYDANKFGLGSLNTHNPAQPFIYTPSNQACKYVRFVAVTTPDKLNGIATFSKPNVLDKIPVLESEVSNINDTLSDLNSNLYDEMMLGWRVPKDCPIQNEVSGNQFIQKVGRVDLGSLAWTQHATVKNVFSVDKISDMKLFANSLNANWYCAKYDVVDGNHFDSSSGGVIAMLNNAKIFIKDASITDATAFKNAINGVYLYYELATLITMQIDGNEALSKVNASLDDYGLDSIPTDLENGTIDDSGNLVVSNSKVRDKQFRNCNAGDTVTVISQTDSYWIGIACYKADGTFISLVKSSSGHLTKATFTAPTNTAKYKVVLSLYSNMTPSQVGRVVSYVNNAIEQIKADLSEKVGNGVKGYRDIVDGEYNPSISMRGFSATDNAIANTRIFDYFNDNINEIKTNLNKEWTLIGTGKAKTDYGDIRDIYDDFMIALTGQGSVIALQIIPSMILPYTNQIPIKITDPISTEHYVQLTYGMSNSHIYVESSNGQYDGYKFFGR